MNIRSLSGRLVIALAAAALVLTGCGRGSDDAPKSDSPDDTPAATASPGMTAEACPEAVNPDNGCIYLGVLSDLTVGPFAPLAVPITEAQEAFWRTVNEAGGVGGYDINITKYTADNEYDPQVHNQEYQKMREHILALAQTLGSIHTLAVLDDMKADNIIGVPASWNSAWDFEKQIMQTGASYCFEGMNGVDWAVENRGAENKVVAVGYAGDYGGDAAAGVKAAAEAHGMEFVGLEAPAGQDNQTGTITSILQEQPDLVFVSTGPAEMATIVGGLAQQGFQGTVMGSSPTWNVALLQSAAAPALEALYFQVGPWGPFGTDTPGHQAMREALGDVTPNDGYAAGWAWSYPLLAALELAAEEDGGITRENLVKASTSLTEVDFEGMLPSEAGNKVGDAAETAWRASVISKVDPDAPTGVSIVQDFKAGSTASNYDYAEPCFSLT